MEEKNTVKIEALREATQAQKYMDSWRRSREDLFDISNASAKRIAALVRNYREEVDKILKTFQDDPSAPFSARVAAPFRRSVNDATKYLAKDASGETRKTLETAFDKGSKVAASSLRDVGFDVFQPEIAPNLLRTLADTSGNLMTEFTGNLGNRIMSKVQSGILQLKPASTVRNEIEDMLATSGEYKKGLRQRVGLGYQAEEIQRTELGRAYSIANQASTEQIGQTIPGLRKKWVASAGSRQGHLEAEKRYSEDGEIGPIPVDDRYEVFDYSRTGVTNFITFGKNIQPRFGSVPGMRVSKVATYSRRGDIITDNMLHPMDPSASSGNSVNCRCISVNILPKEEPSEIS